MNPELFNAAQHLVEKQGRAIRRYKAALAKNRGKRRADRERRKQLTDGMHRIAFIATDCASDDEAPAALDSIRGVAYSLIGHYEVKP